MVLLHNSSETLDELMFSVYNRKPWHRLEPLAMWWEPSDSSLPGEFLKSLGKSQIQFKQVKWGVFRQRLSRWKAAYDLQGSSSVPDGFAHLCFDLVRISCCITFPALGIKWKAPPCYRMDGTNSSNSFPCQLTIRTTQLAENVASSLLDWLKQSCSGTWA